MNPVLAFVVVMLVWTISDWVSKKTASLLSSLFVASLIFLIGFMTGLFPEDLLASSSLLSLAGVVVGFIIVHLGTMISLDDFKKQWRTLLIGIATVVGIGVLLLVAGLVFGGGQRDGAYDQLAATALDYVIAGIGALSGGTISVLLVQDAALDVGLTIGGGVPRPDRGTPGPDRVPADLLDPAAGGRSAEGRVSGRPARGARAPGGRDRPRKACCRLSCAPHPGRCSVSAWSCWPAS